MSKNKKALIGLLTVLTLILSGCMRYEQTFLVEENGDVTVQEDLAYNKAATDQKLTEEYDFTPEEIEELMAEYDISIIDGKEYYVEDATVRNVTAEDMQDLYPEYIVTPDKFYFYTEDSSEDTMIPGDSGEGDISIEEGIGLSPEDIEYFALKVTLPSEITKTNGSLQEDGHTVIWDFLSVTDVDSTALEIYAYTDKDPGDMETDRETVKKQIQASETDIFSNYRPGYDDPSITPTVTPSVTPPSAADAPQGTLKPTAKPGKNDKKAPVIKGIQKNHTYKNKVTVYVKDNHKLKKVTLNQKTVKLKKVTKGKYKGYYKFTIKKKGRFIVKAYDAAGNCKKIKFRIKK